MEILSSVTDRNGRGRIKKLMARELISQAISQSHYSVPPAKYQCINQVRTSGKLAFRAQTGPDLSTRLPQRLGAVR